MRGNLLAILFFILKISVGQEEKTLTDAIDLSVTDVEILLDSANVRYLSYREKDVNFEFQLYDFEGNILKLVSNRIDGRKFTKREFFLEADKLIFVREFRETMPDIPKWERAKSDTMGQLEEQRANRHIRQSFQYYFHGEKVIKIPSASDKELIQIKMERQLLEEFHTILFWFSN